MRRITEFELVDHGVNHESYFPGCATAYTSFACVITGIGDSPAEAIDDCLDLIAQGEVDTDDMEERILRRYGWPCLSTHPSRCSGCESFGCGDAGDACDACESHYYFSIRYNLGD